MLFWMPKDPSDRPRVLAPTTRWPSFCRRGLLRLIPGANTARPALWTAARIILKPLGSGPKLLAGTNTFIENPKTFGRWTAD